MSTDGAPDSGGRSEKTPDQESGSIGDQSVRPDESVLDVADLNVSYGQVRALKSIDLRVAGGDIVSIIGPNGAGKTTLTDTVGGFLDYTGTIEYRERALATQSQTELVEQGLIYCTEQRDLFGYMTVEENLKLGAYRRGVTRLEENLAFVYDLFPRLEERREQAARTMSGGEQQMLAIGRGLMGNPALLVLDEPTLGLAPVILEDISEALTTIQEIGVTILMTEQNVTFALEQADKICLLENGTVAKTGLPDELRGDDYIRETYLGG